MTNAATAIVIMPFLDLTKSSTAVPAPPSFFVRTGVCFAALPEFLLPEETAAVLVARSVAVETGAAFAAVLAAVVLAAGLVAVLAAGLGDVAVAEDLAPVAEVLEEEGVAPGFAAGAVFAPVLVAAVLAAVVLAAGLVAVLDAGLGDVAVAEGLAPVAEVLEEEGVAPGFAAGAVFAPVLAAAFLAAGFAVALFAVFELVDVVLFAGAVFAAPAVDFEGGVPFLSFSDIKKSPSNRKFAELIISLILYLCQIYASCIFFGGIVQICEKPREGTALKLFGFSVVLGKRGGTGRVVKLRRVEVRSVRVFKISERIAVERFSVPE